MSQGKLQGSLEALIRLSSPPTPEEQAELKAAGYQLRVLSGT